MWPNGQCSALGTACWDNRVGKHLGSYCEAPCPLCTPAPQHVPREWSARIHQKTRPHAPPTPLGNPHPTPSPSHAMRHSHTTLVGSSFFFSFSSQRTPLPHPAHAPTWRSSRQEGKRKGSPFSICGHLRHLESSGLRAAHSPAPRSSALSLVSAAFFFCVSF